MCQQIKKAHLKYAKCQGGDLHQGEVLNLVCVDDRCMHRGLICPVCKAETHDDHYFLPIKTFLTQIKEMIANEQGGDQATNLGGYICAIQSTKRELLNIIKDQINELASLYKEIEMRIEESYRSIRRIVADMQSSSSIKLPKLVELLSNQQKKDPLQLQNEFRKYCELIKYKDGQPKITDKASKLVSAYKSQQQGFKTLGANAIAQYKKKLLQTVKALQSDLKDDKVSQKVRPFLFSTDDKFATIQVNQQKTEAWLDENSYAGVITINRPFSSAQNELTFTVVNSQNQMVFVGLVHVSKLKSSAFQHNAVSSSMQLYINCDGSTSEGQDCFHFSKGDRITVRIDSGNKQCQFVKLGTNQSQKMALKSQVMDNEDVRLCFGLGKNDRIKLDS